jgi:voltage-gated potassium channel
MMTPMPTGVDMVGRLDDWVRNVLADGPMAGRSARVFRLALSLCILSSTAIAILDTVPDAFGGFQTLVRVAELGALAVMAVDYLLRLRLASLGHSDEETPLRALLNYATSPYGIFDFLAVVPFLIGEVVGIPQDAETVFGILRFLKLARFSPALETLGSVILNELRPLAAALFIVVLLAITAATILYFVERADNPAFSSVPQALWWAIVTLTTVGYGDVVPITPLGKLAGAGVAVAGLCMFALPASILASGFAEEMRRHDFVQNWQLVAKVPFFAKMSAGQIAEIAALLKPHRAIRGEVVMREGDMGECMYFIVNGQVEGKAGPATFVLKGGDFFGEIALIERCPRTASVKALTRCMFLILDVRDFQKFVSAYPDLLAQIWETARQRKAQVEELRRAQQPEPVA